MKKLLLIILLIVGCDKSTQPQDCAGIYGGTAELDSCLVCVGGSTDKTPCPQDCAGIWGGSAVLDCANECGGSAIVDCKGECGGSSINDIDGNCYATIQINDQLWMAENLKVFHYKNGDLLNWSPTSSPVDTRGKYFIYGNSFPNFPCVGGTSCVCHSKDHAFQGFLPAFLPSFALVIILYKKTI